MKNDLFTKPLTCDSCGQLRPQHLLSFSFRGGAAAYPLSKTALCVYPGCGHNNATLSKHQGLSFAATMLSREKNWPRNTTD